MNCICQRAYDTGFTGIPRVDARLQAHYDHWLDPDCIKRSYDHYHFGVPYNDAQRGPYCFVTKTKGHCLHEPCEHARHRPPTTVAKMRFYIESHCQAAFHYPDLVDNIDRSGDTRPEMDNVAHLGEQWDERQFQLHKYLTFSPPHRTFTHTTENGARVKTEQLPLRVIPIETFREEWATSLTELPLDDGLQPREASLDSLTAAGIVHVTENLELAATTAAKLARDAFLRMMDDPQELLAESVECGVEAVAA